MFWSILTKFFEQNLKYRFANCCYYLFETKVLRRFFKSFVQNGFTKDFMCDNRHLINRSKNSKLSGQ